MTAIVGILNTQGMALAADSAVTISSGTGVKKVYNKGNKIFTLSKAHRVGIAVFDGASFLGIPWEVLIKMYRAELQQEFDTVQEYQVDFLDFLNKNLYRVPLASRNNSFLSFAVTVYNEVIRHLTNELAAANFNVLPPQDQAAQAPGIMEGALQTYRNEIDTYPKNPINRAITEADFLAVNQFRIDDFITAVTQQIQDDFPSFALTQAAINIIREVLYISTQLAYVFENRSGLVFFGFGKEELFPSSHLVYIGSLICEFIRHEFGSTVSISPGAQESNIIPYAQYDVTYSVLTGIDPQFNREIDDGIRRAFNDAAEQIENNVSDPAEAQAVANIIRGIAQPLVDQLTGYKNEVITQPILDMLVSMGIEDMAELAESLVNVTSLKRKFTAGFESVGGPVDVVVVTKGDGIVWLKRKQYFVESLNSNL